MKKNKIIIIVLVCLAIAGIIVSIYTGITWGRDKAEMAELREKLAATEAEVLIVGEAYIDYGKICARDSYDAPATDLRVQLYEAYKNVILQESKVNAMGQYHFTVEPGKTYYVMAVRGISGYPEWDWVVYLGNCGNIVAEEGELYPGPTILVGKDEALG